MMNTVTLEVTHPTLPAGKVEGFRYLWAYYVDGYDASVHCQPCFHGARVPEFCTPTAETDRIVRLNKLGRYPYVYICGVGAGPKSELRKQNLHFPLRYAEGKTATVTSYNGYVFTARDAEELAIPEWPADIEGKVLPPAFEGKPLEHFRCKNYRFAVAYFGYPPPVPPTARR